MPDVIVIGAGPAGSTAAALLARRGVSVTIVEQHRFPRDKVCGECLSAVGIDVLDRNGIGDSVRKLRPVLLTHAALHPARGRSVRIGLPRTMWGVSRASLDSTLLEAARNAGAVVRQPARCEGIGFSADPTVRIRDLQTNEQIEIRAGCVIVADGKGAHLWGTAERTGDFGIKAHFVNVEGPRDTIELFGCHGLYGGVAAIEGERWNVAFSVPAARLRRVRGNMAALFDEITGENPMLRARMRAARRVDEWIASPLPRFGVRRSWPAHVIPVGNAAAAIEPIGGEGMGLALRSAELAVDALLRASATVPLPLSRYSGTGPGEGLCVAQPPSAVSLCGTAASAVFRRSRKSEASTSSCARTQPRAAVPHELQRTQALQQIEDPHHPFLPDFAESENLREAFVALWQTCATACRAGGIITSRPPLARALLPLINIPMVAHAVFRLTGKL